MNDIKETPEQALARIQSRGFNQNDALAILEFAARGLNADDLTPRVNILTANAWRAKGMRIGKGATSVKVTTWYPCKDKDGNDKVLYGYVIVREDELKDIHRK